MPQVLVNPNSGLAESFEDPNHVNALLEQGYHLPLHDAQGNTFSAPLDEAANLVQSGQYRQPSTDELHGWLNTAKFSSPTEQAKAFIEGAAEGIAGPAAPAMEMAMGVPQEHIAARKALNPGTHFAGQMGSIALATAATGGLFGEALAGAAGAATLPGLIGKASKAAASGIELTGTFGNLAKGMTQGAIEAGLYQANHELSENLLGNSDIFSQHAIADMGIAALLGGGVGGVLSSGFGPFSKVAKEAEKLQGNLEGNLSKIAKIDPFTKETTYEAAGSFFDSLKKQASELKATDFFHAFKSPASFTASQVSKLVSKFGAANLTKIFPQQAQQASALLNTFKTGLNTMVNIEKQSAGLFGYGSFDAVKPTINRNELHDLYERTNSIQMDPETLANHLQQVTTPIAEHLPNTVGSLAKAATAAAEALSSQKPNLQKQAPLDADKKPSPVEIAKFNRTAEFLDKPLSVFSHIKDGSLNNHDMLLLKSVYPSVLESIQKETMRHLIQHQSENKAPLPYKMRLGLSTLFGHPMDSSLTYLSKNQLTLAGMGVQKAMMQPQQSPSKTGMGKMKSGTRDETRAQSALARKGAQ